MAQRVWVFVLVVNMLNPVYAQILLYNFFVLMWVSQGSLWAKRRIFVVSLDVWQILINELVGVPAHKLVVCWLQVLVIEPIGEELAEMLLILHTAKLVPKIVEMEGQGVVKVE